MPRIQDVKLEIVRPGPPHNQLLSPLTPYMALCGDGSPITFNVEFEHRQLLNRLEHLRYMVPRPGADPETVPESTRAGELGDLGAAMGRVLAGLTSLNAELNRARADTESVADRTYVHLRLVLSGSELSLLPFELAVAPQSLPGEGLHFCLQGSLPIVVTREIPRSRPLPVRWHRYARPRILFVSAAPGGLAVPLRGHLHALRAAVDPWITWPGDRGTDHDEELLDAAHPRSCVDRTEIERMRIAEGKVQECLRVLPNASIDSIYETCSRAHGDHQTTGGEDRFGVALCHEDDPNRKVVVDGTRLAAALRAGNRDGRGRSEPVMVTLATCDSGQTGSVLVPGGSIAHDLHAAGIPWVLASQFPLKKRGSVRSMFDGRYTFSRYFSPTEHHRPTSLADLYSFNDLELYDRVSDPDEVTNLAADRDANGDLVLEMSAKLESIIAAEIGVDDGRELPDVDGVDWALPQERFD